MKQLNQELLNSINDVSGNIDTYSRNYELALNTLIDKIENSSSICQIVDSEKSAQIYFNPKAVNYFGVTNEELNKLKFNYLLEYLHPVNFNVVTSHINYFANPDNFNKPLSYIYYVKAKTGYRWMYNCSQVATLTREGKAKYIVVHGADISCYLEGKKKISKFRKDAQFIIANRKIFDSLSDREKTILKLIAEERNSIEIGNLLNISNTTVDTHRNNIIKKLGVRSSIGLVKFALMFDLL